MMDEKKIQEQTLKGLRWSIILSSISFPAGYLTIIILGRLSPEALGTYGLIGLLTNIILGIVFFGGNAVVIKFIPTLPESKVAHFLLTYTGLVSLIAGILCFVAWLFPEYLDFIQKKIGIGFNITYFTFLTFILIYQSIVLAALRAFLNIKTSIILSKMITFGTFGINLLLFFFYHTFFLNNFKWFLWFIYLSLLSASGILGFFVLATRIEKINFKKISFFLPDGFWKFSVPLQLNSVINFFRSNIDQLFVISLVGLNDYGQYLAVLNTVILINLISVVFLEVLLPSFSNMVSLNNYDLLRKAYFATTKFFSFLFGILALLFMFRGDFFLSLFGNNYLAMENIMVIIAASVGLTSVTGINSTIFTATGATVYTFVISIFELLILFLTGIILSKEFGIVGIAMAKAISLISGTYLSILITRKYLKLRLDIPKTFWVKSLIVGGGATLIFFYPLQGQLVPSLLMFLSMGLLFAFGGIEEQDIRMVKQVVYGKII